MLVAYNLWLAGDRTPGDGRPLGMARQIAATIRGPEIRALGLLVGDRVQVSCNLTEPWIVGPAAAFDAVASQADVDRAELVGLVPLSVLERRTATTAGQSSDLDPSTTIEARLEQAGLDGGRFPAQGPGTLAGHATGPALERPPPADLAPLSFAQAAPDAELLAVGQGVLQTVLADDTAAADLLGLPGRRAPFGEEQVGVDAHAVGLALPSPLRRLAHHVHEIAHRYSPQSVTRSVAATLTATYVTTLM